MTSAKKIYLAVAGGLVAVGVILAGIGFVVSGFDPDVFSCQIDMHDGTVILGGVEVDEPAGAFPSSSLQDWARLPLSLPRRD